MSKVMDFLHKVEPEIIQAVVTAEKVTSSILAWLKSPQGQTIEEVLAAVVPQGQTWTNDVIILCQAFTKGLEHLTNPAQWLGIMFRLGVEIIRLIHGNKHPQGITGYIDIFNSIF